MSKIKFHLVKLERKLIFQILDQVHMNNHRYNGIHIICNDESWLVASVSSPQIKINEQLATYFEETGQIVTNNRIYVRGSSSDSNFKEVSLCFSSNEERDKCYSSILFVLKEAFNSLDKWRNFS